MRLFLAIDIPEALRKLLQALFREPLPGFRWVRPDQVHLTLRFLGECSEEGFFRIRSAFSDLNYPGFVLSPRGLGVFPNAKRPRILWAGLEPEPALLRLQSGIEKALRDAGLPAEAKAFHPHLTLARSKSPTPRALETFLAGHRDFRAEPFPVHDFHLYSSRLSPKGAEYRREASFPLL